MHGTVFSPRSATAAVLALFVWASVLGAATAAHAAVGADIGLVMSASPDPAQVGDTLTFSIVVNNHGTGNADNIVVTNVLSSDLTLIGAVPSVGSCSGSGTLVCSLGTLPPGSSDTITITTTPTATGPVSSSAMGAANVDLNVGDNSASKTVQVVDPAGGGGGLAPTADLGVTMDASPDPGTVGARMTWTIPVTNAGPDDAVDVTLVDLLPKGASFGSVSSTKGTCTGSVTVVCSIGTLGSGKTASVSISAVPQAEGTISNSASVVSATVDPNPLNNQVTRSTNVLGASGPTGRCTIKGTAGVDRLRGTPGDDVICGLGGDDRLIGVAGDDIIRGGSGNDVLRGGGGNDRVLAGPGDDALSGAAGNDQLRGGPGVDRYNGGSGRDRCRMHGGEPARGCE
jgi:uncharacterized repeat protein (TIGR01451 family)